MLGPSTRVTGYLGIVHRNIGLSPADPASQVTKKDNGIKMQLELASRPVERLDIFAIGSYTGNIGDKYFRLRPGYVATDRIVVGPDFAAISGESYSKRRLGVAVDGVPLSATAGINFQLGREKDRRNQETNSYVGVSFSARF